MKITASQHLGADDKPTGYIIWLSKNDTYRWSRRVGCSWPCSSLRNKALRVDVDSNGLCDLAINGKSGEGEDCDGNELDAIIADHLPERLQHLWPCWGKAPQHPVR